MLLTVSNTVNKNISFAKSVCTYKKNNSVVFSEASLVFKTEHERKNPTYNAVNIFDIPWDQLVEIGKWIFDTVRPNLESTVTD